MLRLKANQSLFQSKFLLEWVAICSLPWWSYLYFFWSLEAADSEVEVLHAGSPDQTNVSHESGEIPVREALSGVILSFTWAFCRTSIICSRWCSKVINRSTIEICAGIFFQLFRNILLWLLESLVKGLCCLVFLYCFPWSFRGSKMVRFEASSRPSHISYLSTFFTLFLLT